MAIEWTRSNKGDPDADHVADGFECARSNPDAKFSAGEFEWAMNNNGDTDAEHGVGEFALTNNNNNTPGSGRFAKLNGWTSRRAVKVMSFILVIALGVLILNRFVAIIDREMQTRVSLRIVFDVRLPQVLQDDQAFFDENISIALRHIRNIRDTNIIGARNIEAELLSAIPGIRFFVQGTYEIVHRPRGWVAPPNLQPDILVELRQFEFYNTDRNDFAYFMRYPVHYIMSDAFIHASHHLHNLLTLPPHGMTIFLAFEDDVVRAAGIDFNAVRAAYIFDLVVIAAAFMMILFLLVVLLLGAGRRFGHPRGSVHFLTIDKPYLDVGLFVVIVWMFFAVFIAFQFYDLWMRWGRWGTRHINMFAYTLLFSGAAILVGPPPLLWLMSFAKRAKAGRFWRHTLIFALPARFGRLSKSLWSGLNLMLKVAMISAGTCFMLMFVGIVGLASSRSGFGVAVSVIIATCIVAFLLLRYTRRIYKLEVYAAKVGNGEYGAQVDIGGGELGKIADSISGISAGINTAVEQRIKSERMRTELITNVSHDIRTPLTSIITYTDLLKNEGLGCQKAPEYLDILIQKSARLKTLTDELFEAAKASSGNIEVNITQLDLVSLINQVLGELDSAINASGLDLRVNLPERLLVRADGRLLWRVMENLLSNVFKYSLPGSRVYLTTELVKHGKDNMHLIDADSVLIELKNISATELNIDPSELTERFKRGDDSRADGGSGLGLSIVQSFVTAQGGKFVISIDGDLFKAAVYLPPAEPSAEE